MPEIENKNPDWYLCGVGKEIVISSLEDLHRAAKEFLQHTTGYKIFAFHGEMGAGKTTFIKALCTELGVSENTSSPTFAIVNEYAGTSTIFHFDLYRIRSLQELIDIGFEEYPDRDAYIFIEWPELAMPLLEGIHYCDIFISTDDSGARKVNIPNPGI